MALKRRFQDEDIAQKLISDSDSDAHTSDGEDNSPPQSESDNEG
jgi:hypothetical protein